MTALSLVTAPAVEPVGLQEAKDHLRIDTADEDALIDSFIMVARQKVESHTGRSLITQTWDWKLDRFRHLFEVPKGKLQSVTSVKYFDSDNVEQTVASTVYEVDAVSEPGRIREADGQTWPNHFNRLNAVTIRFVAGYGATGNFVPWPIKAAMLLMVGHLWCNREASATREVKTVPMGFQDLLAPYVMRKF